MKFTQSLHKAHSWAGDLRSTELTKYFLAISLMLLGITKLTGKISSYRI